MSRPDYLQAYDAWISSICQERHTKFPMSLLEKRKMAALFLKKSKRIENDADGVARPNYDDIVSGMSFEQNFESDTRINNNMARTNSGYGPLNPRPIDPSFARYMAGEGEYDFSYLVPGYVTPIPQADAVSQNQSYLAMEPHEKTEQWEAESFAILDKIITHIADNDVPTIAGKMKVDETIRNAWGNTVPITVAREYLEKKHGHPPGTLSNLRAKEGRAEVIGDPGFQKHLHEKSLNTRLNAHDFQPPVHQPHEASGSTDPI